MLSPSNTSSSCPPIKFVIAGACRQHAFTPAPLSRVVWRRRNVDDHLGASGEHLMECRTVRIPDVLTDGDADLCTQQFQYTRVISGLKVTELIEDAIVWQIHLVIDVDDVSILQGRRGVEDVLFAVDETHDNGDSFRGIRDASEGPQIRVDKLRLEKEILRRVTRKSKFGKRHDIGVGFARQVDPAFNFLGVSLDIADHHVDLSHGQTEF
jgi:hypothetical protein